MADGAKGGRGNWGNSFEYGVFGTIRALKVTIKWCHDSKGIWF